MMGCEAWSDIRQKHLEPILKTRVVRRLQRQIDSMLAIEKRYQTQVDRERSGTDGSRDSEIARLGSEKIAALRKVGGVTLADAFLLSTRNGQNPLEDALTTVVFGGSYGGVRIKGWSKGKPSRSPVGSELKQAKGDRCVHRASAFAFELLQSRWKTISSWRSLSGDPSSGQSSNE
jgi:hypothetical protein